MAGSQPPITVDFAVLARALRGDLSNETRDRIANDDHPQNHTQARPPRAPPAVHTNGNRL